MPNQYVNKVIYGGNTLIDLTGDTVTASDVLSGVKFHLPTGEQKTGTCTYDVDSSSCTALVANNIREGVEIFGVIGTMSGSENMKPQSKTVTPTSSTQTILPDSPTYNCLSQVTVNAIPYTETDNAAGGKTVTIG